MLQGKQAVAFERFMAFRRSGGNHCHINVVPVPASAAATARATFDRAAAAISAEFTELPRSSGEVQFVNIAFTISGFSTSDGAAFCNQDQKPDQERTPAATSDASAGCDTAGAVDGCCIKSAAGS